MAGFEQPSGTPITDATKLNAIRDQLGIPREYTWSGKPSAASVSGKTILITDVGTGGGSMWRSNGTNWYPVGGQVRLTSQPGPVSVASGTSAYVAFPGGTPMVPGGLLMSGSGGSQLRYEFYVTKTGTAGTSLIADARFGNANSPSDSQVIGQPLANSGNTFGRFVVEIYFPTSTSFYSFWHVIVPSGLSSYTSGVGGSIDLANPLYFNVGCTGATVGDGVKVEGFLATNFR